jgi:uncharacterized protein YjeT (DUF2065 family)
MVVDPSGSEFFRTFRGGGVGRRAGARSAGARRKSALGQRHALGRAGPGAGVRGPVPLPLAGGWRSTFQKLLQLRDGQLRFFGLCSILLGLVLLWWSADQASPARPLRPAA